MSPLQRVKGYLRVVEGALDGHLMLLPELSSLLQVHEKTGCKPHLARVQGKEMTKYSSCRHFRLGLFEDKKQEVYQF